ncbi:hypothetical protein TSOC_010950 [Tetrabaena socialis]|uniref:RAP domain-containing protein n=1 Tax=Tetrabaena socialis TaxID=47790 RepID=A0A2J7ZRX1_9CHLO|nr:hypothetical protein TSOC_010950 [Tetrabaena socialis]|eukprot:PNH03026.1 hypothetical protein TSOC_010950 [Tetrabaena socialis]
MDMRRFDSLPSLAAAVKAGAAEWAADRNVGTLCAAFHRACTLGMAPGQLPRDGDPNWDALLHRTFATLAAAFLPLVPWLRYAKHCTLPLWAFAKAGYWGGDGLAVALLRRLGRDRGALMLPASAQSHADLWWSLSRAPPEVLSACSEELLSCSAGSLLRMGAVDIETQDCSNMLLACARLRHCRRDLLHHLTACLAAAQPAARYEELANGLYALGELCEDCGHAPRPQDLKRLATAVVGRLPGGPRTTRRSQQQDGGSGGGFIPQEVSKMLLGCSMLGYADPALLRPLAEAARLAAVRMEAQHLANSLYALGVLGCVGPGYALAVEGLVSEVRHRLLLKQPTDAFKPQELSSILYALALLQPEQGHQWKAAVNLLAGECKRREFAGFSARGLSNSAWALEKLGYRSDQGLFGAAVAAAVRPGIMRTFKCQDLSDLWYTLALVRHRPVAALLEGTVAASEELRTQASGQHCANLLWSLASLGGPYDRRLVDALVERLWRLVPEGGKVNDQELVNSLWALAVMGPGALFRYRPSVERMLRTVAGRWNEAEAAAVGHSTDAGPFTAAALTQLWQAQQELVHADGCRELAGILAADGGGDSQRPGSLLSAMRYAAEYRVQPGTATLQREVVSALGRLQLQRQEDGVRIVATVSKEQEVEGLAGRADVAVELAGGRRVAVEVHGPAHSLANAPYMSDCTGSTQLHDRHLGRCFGAGNVVSVPYWEWDKLGRNRRRQEEYLLRLLGLLGLSSDGP